jgi:hypothetical protein
VAEMSNNQKSNWVIWTSHQSVELMGKCSVDAVGAPHCLFSGDLRSVELLTPHHFNIMRLSLQYVCMYHCCKVVVRLCGSI